MLERRGRTMCNVYKIICKEDTATEEETPYDYHGEEPFEDVAEDEEQEWCD